MNVDPYKSHMNYYRDLVSRHNSIKISEIIPPYEGMIYHYTSVNAFCSILESSKLRLTNKKYLNDTTEGSYIFDLCKREAESLCRKRAEAKEQFLTLCDKIKREKARYNILEAYQCSFSTTSDNLCLWNYYTHGDSVQGYNLGFDSQLLHKSLNTKHSEKSYFQAGKVIYDEKKQLEIIQKIADEYFEYFCNYAYSMDISILGMLTNTIYLLLDKLFYIGQFFKKKCFEAEYEYRIVYESGITINSQKLSKSSESDEVTPEIFENSENLAIRFFPRNGILVPYSDVKFLPVALKSIKLSPTLENDIAREGALLASQNNFSATIKSIDDISVSEIPVRF